MAGPDSLPLRPDHIVRVYGHGGQAEALRRGVQHVARLGHRARRGGRGGGSGSGARGLSARRALQEALLPARALGRVGRRRARRGLGAPAHVTPTALAARSRRAALPARAARARREARAARARREAPARSSASTHCATPTPRARCPILTVDFCYFFRIYNVIMYIIEFILRLRCVII